MIRKMYRLTDFYQDYSRNTNKYCVFIKINSLGRDAGSIIKTLSSLNVSLDELKNNTEYLVEEYETLPGCWDRYNQVKDLGWDVQCCIYYQGQLISAKD